MSGSINYFIALLISMLLLAACNTEEGIIVQEAPSFVRIIPGESNDNVPIQLITLSNNDLLIVANSSSFIDAESVSKIRLIRMTLAGEKVYDLSYPADETTSWSAVDVVYVNDGQIIIGGNTDDNAMLLISVNANGELISQKNDYPNASSFISISKDDSDAIIALSVSPSNEELIYTIAPADLSIVTNALAASTGRQLPEQPTSEILLKDDKMIYAINDIINYVSFDEEETADVDASLSVIDADALSVKFILNDEDAEQSMAFGELRNGNLTQLFSAPSFPSKEITATNFYVQSGNATRSLESARNLQGGFLLSGSTERPDASSNFLLIKTDAQGKSIFTQVFGAAETENALYDALEIENSIYAVGTTNFDGGASSFIVLFKMDVNGRLLN